MYVCTDDAMAIMGHKAGAISKIKDKGNICSISQYVFHRQELFSRKLSSEFMTVLNNNIKMINCI